MQRLCESCVELCGLGLVGSCVGVVWRAWERSGGRGERSGARFGKLGEKKIWREGEEIGEFGFFGVLSWEGVERRERSWGE